MSVLRETHPRRRSGRVTERGVVNGVPYRVWECFDLSRKKYVYLGAGKKNRCGVKWLRKQENRSVTYVAPVYEPKHGDDK